MLKRWLPVATAVIGIIVSTAVAVVGTASVPLWAILLVGADLTGVGYALTSAVTGGDTKDTELGIAKRHNFALWASTVLLVFLVGGVFLYHESSSQGLVNVVPDNDIVLSPQPGAPPRGEYNAPSLIAGEPQTTTCYVRVHGQVWLFSPAPTAAGRDNSPIYATKRDSVTISRTIAEGNRALYRPSYRVNRW
jgi:hypothetical protein